MATLHVTKIGHPVLRRTCECVSKTAFQDETFKTLIENMVETMHDYAGVGLAANQVGVGLQAFVLECRMSERYPGVDGDIPLEIYTNPTIIEYSKKTEEDWEGCLSIPGYRGRVARSRSVTFRAQNHQGEEVTKTVEGFHARIVQHEVDHLNGLFYMDRMPDLQQWYANEEFNKKFGTEIEDK